MTAQELAQMLQEAGLDQNTVSGLVNNAAFQQKASALARQAEVQAAQGNYAAAKRYEDWYNEHYPAVRANAELLQTYEERFGKLNGQPQQQQQQTQQSQQPVQGKYYTEQQIQDMIDNRVLKTFGPQVTNSIVGSSKIVEQHYRNGRKNEIDWNKITELARERNGDVEAAYREWDAPERTKAEEAAYKAKLKTEVDAEVEKRMLSMHQGQFPGGAGGWDEAEHSMNSPLSAMRNLDENGKVKAYDRSAVLQAATEVMRDPNYRPGFSGKAN